ncbi:MAG: heme biosynthesis protein HemY [Candidatus Binatia bacterium]|nr:MAG: heme biosynthesis protein HemY [Candidatus Binatia bacterium]
MGIEISEQAAARIQALVGQDPARGLRIKVVGGGCSGLTYKMELDSPKENDRVFERGGAKVIVDPKSFLYLKGTVLEYRDTLMEAGFHLRNPNAKRTCGCGASFSI